MRRGASAVRCRQRRRGRKPAGAAALRAEAAAAATGQGAAAASRDGGGVGRLQGSVVAVRHVRIHGRAVPASLAEALTFKFWMRFETFR